MRKVLIGVLILILFGLYTKCGDSGVVDKAPPEVKTYVGQHVCLSCHEEHGTHYLASGMGQSQGKATPRKSALPAHLDSLELFDPHSGFYYQPHWSKDSILELKESQFVSDQKVYEQVVPIDFVIGSGQHTNSHLIWKKGYLHQAPFTYYTQKQKLGLPPGFENGNNTRFTRKIDFECQTCHNAIPKHVAGSINKFEVIPEGIDCERCHGPGSLHVAKANTNQLTEDQKWIVQPKKLEASLQMSLCKRCHLQGNTVLRNNKDFDDFQPGMLLDSVMTVFLPEYRSEEAFLMAGHVDRLEASSCFIKSEGQLTCVSCHSPHRSVSQKNELEYNAVCQSCHSAKHPTIVNESQACVSCHMPKNGAIDIPHVSITDHKIASPSKTKENTVRGGGKYALKPHHNQDLQAEIWAEAYLNQYEKFDRLDFLLDSALVWSKRIEKGSKHQFANLVRYYYLKEDYSSIDIKVKQFGGESWLKNQFQVQNSRNDDAWTLFRVAYAFEKNRKKERALKVYQMAIDLAPFILEFQVKQADLLLKSKKTKAAKSVFQSVIVEYPSEIGAVNGMGKVMLMDNKMDSAQFYFEKAYGIDPNNRETLINLTWLYGQERVSQRKPTIQRKINAFKANEKED